MKNFVALFFFFIPPSSDVLAAPPKNYNLMIAPATVTDKSATLLRDKEYGKDSMVYQIPLNEKVIASK